MLSNDTTPDAVPTDISVATSFARLLTDYCDNNGVAKTQLMHMAGIAALDLADPDARVPAHDFIALGLAAQTCFQVESIGLVLGKQIRPEHFGPYGFALISAGSVREMLNQAARYSLLAISTGRNVFKIEGDECVRYWQSYLPAHSAGDALTGDLVMASCVTMARHISGLAEIAPAWASFRHPAPRDLMPYQMHFRCPLRFDAEHYAVGMPAKLLDYPVLVTHEEIRVAMASVCERRLQDMSGPQDPDWLVACRRYVVEALAQGTPDLGEAASLIGIAPSTLRVRLAKSSTGFRQLVDDIRHDLAVQHLKEGQLNLIEISFLLGYSEQSAFQRAFKRRMGVTPGEYRAQSKT
jgi:AraC-like DNA-binding protein